MQDPLFLQTVPRFFGDHGRHGAFDYDDLNHMQGIAKGLEMKDWSQNTVRMQNGWLESCIPIALRLSYPTLERRARQKTSRHGAASVPTVAIPCEQIVRNSDLTLCT